MSKMKVQDLINQYTVDYYDLIDENSKNTELLEFIKDVVNDLENLKSNLEYE